MKYFQLYRLGFYLSLKTILAYVFEKIFRISVFKNQASLIAYFNILVNHDLVHVSAMPNHSVVKSSEFGLLCMRWPPSSDAKVYVQVFEDKEYEALVTLIQEHIRGADVRLIDGGANVGYTSIYVNSRLIPDKQLKAVLVEPFDENVKMITHNLSVQGISDFRIERAGIHNRSANLALQHAFRDQLEWSTQVEETNEISEVKGVQITDLMNKYGWSEIDVLKLDIEGAERYLFSDKEYAAHFLKYVKIIAVEIHKEYIDESQVLACLEASGFDMFKHGELYCGFRRNPNAEL